MHPSDTRSIAQPLNKISTQKLSFGKYLPKTHHIRTRSKQIKITDSRTAPYQKETT